MTRLVPNNDTARQQTGTALETGAPSEAVYSSRQLFGDKTEIRIEHQGELYRLRITRSGGLLLNK